VTIVEGRVEVREHPEPVPGRGQLLVRVRGAGLNAADLAQIAGGYPAPPGWPQDIPGIELAGEVVGLGQEVIGFAPGDRVMALVGGGAQAELALVHAAEAMRVPAALDWGAAAGFPEGYVTAHDALFTQAALALGERVLITGAAGGVGTAAVQLAVAAGAAVTASVRDPARRSAVAALGAVAVDPSEVADHAPFDVVLELVGLASLDVVLPSLAPGGRVCLIGGGVAGAVDLGPLMVRRGRLYGSTLRGRSPVDKAAAVGAVAMHVVPLLEDGRLGVPVDARFSLDDATAAYDHFARGHKFGKVVLTLEDR
jgi:NADPH:quinone reductase-like Zn-dependent oxidoreductase